MRKAFEALKVRAIEAVKNDDVNKLGTVCDRKDVSLEIANRYEKNGDRDFLGLSTATVVEDGKEYSLIGLAIKNRNHTMIRMLGLLGCNPLYPAYKKRGEPVSVLQYLKEKTKEVDKDFEKSIEMGDVNFAIYHNKVLAIEPDQMIENLEKFSQGKLKDIEMFETLFFYRYDIYTCEYTFESEGRRYYPVEYLIKNHKENVLPFLEERTNSKEEELLIPYHGVDKEALIHELTRWGYIQKEQAKGEHLIDNKSPDFKGRYTFDEVVNSIRQEEKYQKGIEMQRPNWNFLKKSTPKR